MERGRVGGVEDDFHAVDEEELVEVHVELEIVVLFCVPDVVNPSIVVHEVGNGEHLSITVDLIAYVAGGCNQRERRRHPHRLRANQREREGKIQRGYGVRMFVDLHGQSVGAVHEKQRRNGEPAWKEKESTTGSRRKRPFAEAYSLG